MQLRKTKSKKTLVVSSITALIVVVAIGIGAYALTRPSGAPTEKQPGGAVKLAPPTNEEKTAGDTQKAVDAQRQQAVEKSEAQAGLKQVTPVITYADKNGVNAYVSGIFEDGGTCTAHATMDAYSFEKTSIGFKDATTTSCTPISFSSTDFPAKGDWQITLTYTSTTAQGTSQVTTVKVD